MYQVKESGNLKPIKKILAIHLFTSELPKGIKVSIFTRHLQQFLDKNVQKHSCFCLPQNVERPSVYKKKKNTFKRFIVQLPKNPLKKYFILKIYCQKRSISLPWIFAKKRKARRPRYSFIFPQDWSWRS